MAKLTEPQRGVIIGVFLLFAVILAGVIGFSVIEKWHFLDAFYMTIISITTVGFSEVNPLSSAGRVLTTIIILAGLGTIFYTTTMLGRVILEGEFRGTLKRRSMNRQIHQLSGHSILCGFGRTGRVVAKELHADGRPFCVVEIDREMEKFLDEAGYVHIMGDATDEHVLKEAGIDRAKSVMALLSSDADNLYLTINAKELNPAAKVVARAFDDVAERRLKRAGADNVVATFKLSGLRVLQAAVRPTVNEFIELVSDRAQLSLIMEEVTISKDSSLVGNSLEDAQVRTNYGVIIIAIKKPDGEMVFNPQASVVLGEGDIVIAMGEEGALHRLGADCSPGTPI